MPASRTGIQVEGAKQLRATLKRAGADLSDLKAANADAAKVVEQAAGPAAPHVSGRLAGSGRSSGTATAGIVRFGGSSVRYANPIHWGWPARNIEPHPFVSDTLESKEPEVLDVYGAAVDDILAKVKGI